MSRVRLSVFPQFPSYVLFHGDQMSFLSKGQSDYNHIRTYRGVPHIKRTGMLVENFEKNPLQVPIKILVCSCFLKCFATKSTFDITSTGQNLKWDHFDILAKGRLDTHYKIKETLLIRELKPTVNDNVSRQTLYLY